MTRPAAIILAGTHIWSSGSLESLCPRAILPIVNTPLILHTLYWLRDAGVRTVIICTNDAGHALERMLGDGAALGLDLYFYEDHIPRGPAGCSRDAALFTTAEQFVVVEGSILPGVPLDAVLETHNESNCVATVLVDDNPEPTGAPDRVAMSPAGIYIFERGVLEAIPASSYQDIKETLLPKLARAGEQVGVHVAEQPLPWVSALDSYLAVQEWLLERSTGHEHFLRHYCWQDGAFVHERAQIEPGARIVGPIAVGPHSRIDADAVVIGPVTLGCNCVIEAGAVVERSVLWDRARVERAARCDLTLLANDAVLRTGAAEQFAIVSAQQKRTTRRRMPVVAQRTESAGLSRVRGSKG